MKNRKRLSHTEVIDFSSLDGDSDRYIWITEFDDETLQRFYKKFIELESDHTLPFIPVVISSYGGEVDIVVAMRDIIKSASKPVATIALGKAMSAGATLLAAGTKGYRFASPSTSIMLHEASSYTHGKMSDLKNYAELIKKMQDNLEGYLAEDTGLSRSKIRTLFVKNNNADTYLTSNESKDLGIIDHVIIPRLQRVPHEYFLGLPQVLVKKKVKKKAKSKKKATKKSTSSGS